MTTPRLTVPGNGISWVSFPPGPLSLGGTCEWATRECLQYCYAMSEHNPLQDEALEFFTDESIGLIIETLLMELKGEKHLGWFTSGDCPTNLRETVALVMEKLAERGIVQQGFTRNTWLWKRANAIGCKMVLTMEGEVLKEEALVQALQNGPVAFPSPREGFTDIYRLHKGKRKKMSGGCGNSYMYTEGDTAKSTRWSPAQCRTCMENAKGCWDHD